MSTNISSQNTGSGGDTITLQIGSRKIEVSESFARSLDAKFDAISAGVDSSGRYSTDDRLYQDIQRTVDTLNLANSRAAGLSNPDRIDSSGKEYLIDLTSKLVSTQRDAEVPTAPDAERGDAANVKEMVDLFRDAFDDGMEAKYPTPPSASLVSDTSSGGSGSERSGSVKELLTQVKETDNTSEKVSLLSDAIAKLVQQLRGGGSDAEPTGSEKAGSLLDTIDALKDGISDQEPASSPSSDAAELMSGINGLSEAVKDSPAAQGNGLLTVASDTVGNKEKSAADDAPESGIGKTFSGDDLLSMLAGTRGDKSNARLTYDAGGDEGIGIKDDEIGLGETMTFRPEGPSSGASIELVDLFADEKGGQEVAKITLMKDGEEVKTIEVRGDDDGDRTIKFDDEFDELVFTPGNGLNSDFAIKSITTDTAGAASPPAEDGPAADTPIVDAPGDSDPAVEPATPVSNVSEPDPAPPADNGKQTWSASISYDAKDALTVQYKNQDGDWVDLDAKGQGSNQGSNPADFTTDGMPELRVLNKSQDQIIQNDGDTADQVNYIEQADGSIRIEFEDRPDKSGKYDFNDAVITLTPGTPSAGSTDDAESVDGTTDVDDDSATLVSDTSSQSTRTNFDTTQLLSLLDALADAVSLIDGDTGLSSEQRDELFNNISDTIAAIAGGLDQDSEGGADITLNELADVLMSVDTLEDEITDNGDFDSDTDGVRNALGDGAVALEDGLLGGDAQLADTDDDVADEEAVLI